MSLSGFMQQYRRMEDDRQYLRCFAKRINAAGRFTQITEKRITRCRVEEYNVWFEKKMKIESQAQRAYSTD